MRMIRICFMMFLGILGAFVLLLPEPAPAFNPAPAKGDLILPMPGGQEMAFRPVFLGQGAEPYALKRFTMGDPDGGYKESPTQVAIGGAFVAQRNGKGDWCYYMGKYEVTEGQYYAVMGLPQGAAPDLLKSELPVTGISLFDALAFLDAYNQWLFANALATLPKSGEASGFVRLPSEPEWEFAARGGVEVPPDVFDRKIPYAKTLAEYEWFSGPSSSHNKLKHAGQLAPNPVGLHDMLGNVAEMTFSLYQIEYYQGRSGGFVSRGGHYLTTDSSMRSAMRTEEPFYIGSQKKGFRPNAKETMGFRVALSSIIYTDRNAAKALELAWEDYRAGAGADLPAAVSTAAVSVKSDVKTEEALAHLERVASSAGLAPELAQELGYVRAALSDMRQIRKEADEDSAYAWAKIAAEQGFFLYRELMKLPAVDQALESAKVAGRAEMIEKLEARKAEMAANIEGALSSYADSMRQLATTPAPAVEQGFARYADFLMERQAADQVRLLKTVRTHFARFAKDKRADTLGWRKDYEALVQ